MLEKFVANLMAQAGIEPAQIVQAYQLVMAWQAEIDAFKQGAAHMVAHYNARFDRLSEQLDRIERLTERLAVSAGVLDVPENTLSPTNGKAPQ